MQYYTYDSNGIINLDIKDSTGGTLPLILDYLEVDTILEKKEGWVYLLNPDTNSEFNGFKSSKHVYLVRDYRGCCYYDREGKHTLTEFIDLDARLDITLDNPPNGSYNAWDGSEWVFYPWLVEVKVDEPVSVSVKQGKCALLDFDVVYQNKTCNLLESLESSIDYLYRCYQSKRNEHNESLDYYVLKEIKRIIIEYETTTVYTKDCIFITLLKTKHQLTSHDIDVLFIKAEVL